MKKITIFLILASLIFAGCASYVAISSENPSQIEEIRSMNKLGVVVLLKIKGCGHLMIGDLDVPDDEQEWAVGGYSELSGSTIIGVKSETIRNKYLPTNKAAAEIAAAAAAVLGNGPVYNYSYVKGYSLRPDIVSNENPGAAGNSSFIEAPEVIAINTDFKFDIQDRELIPFAIRQGTEKNIDGLIVIKAELIAEGGEITNFSSGETTGSPMGDWNNSLSVGDFFARSEVFIDSCSVIDTKTGEYIAELRDEITGYSVMNARSFHKLDGISSHEGLRKYFQAENYKENLRSSAAYQMALLVPYLRPHFHTYYEKE